MKSTSLTRRGFMTAAVAASGAVLLERGTAAQRPAIAKDMAAANLTHPSVEKVVWKAKPFPMSQVRLLPSYWMDMMELNRSFLYSLPNDRLAHNFRVTAGIASDAAPLGGWEAPDCELRGHYVGHHLSACALQHASTGDTAILEKANALVAMLSACQAKDGYLGAYPAAFYENSASTRRSEHPFTPTTRYLPA